MSDPVTAALQLGTAIAKAADKPDDVDRANAIKRHFSALGHALRVLSRKRLKAGARADARANAAGHRAALRELGVSDEDIAAAG